MSKIAKKIKIFCHSNDDNLVSSFRELFETKGKITTTNFASDLIKKLKSKIYFDIVIIDLEIKINEILAELLNYRNKNKSSFIIILYSYRFNEPVTEGMIRKSVDTFFYKPVSIEDVVKLVEQKMDLLILKGK